MPGQRIPKVAAALLAAAAMTAATPPETDDPVTGTFVEVLALTEGPTHGTEGPTQNAGCNEH